MKRIFLVFLILLMLLPLSACGDAKESSSRVSAMNTNFSVTAYGKNGERGIKAAESVILALDASCDPENATSTVYAINHANGAPVSLSGQLADMLFTAADIYEKTGGSYDLTIHPLVERWGFTNGQYYIPSENEITNGLNNLCMDSIVVNKFPTSGTYSVTLPYYGQLSFASCARGCAGKYAAEAMKNVGVESAVISLSGHVQTIGKKPDGSDWKIAIEDPNKENSYLATVQTGETAIVTSGAYQQTFVSNGKTYHHILNPKSGFPVNNGLVSVTILCENGTEADCLSTAMYVLGKSAAIRYWRENGGFDMILITDDNEITCTSGLIEKVDLKNPNYTLNYVE